MSRIGLPLASLLVPQEITERRDVKAGFGLVGYHLGGGRASIELLGGLGLVNGHVTVVTEIRLPVPAAARRLPLRAHDLESIMPWPWSARAAVSLTTHAALVPQVRAYVLNGALQVRPGLGLRWTFSGLEVPASTEPDTPNPPGATTENIVAIVEGGQRRGRGCSSVECRAVLSPRPRHGVYPRLS